MNWVVIRRAAPSISHGSTSEVFVDILMKDSGYKITMTINDNGTNLIENIKKSTKNPDIEEIFETLDIHKKSISRIDFYKNDTPHDGPEGQPSTTCFDREGHIRQIFHRQDGKLQDPASGNPAVQIFNATGYVTAASHYAAGAEVSQVSPAEIDSMNSHLPSMPQPKPKYGRHFRPPGA